ncbi:hypothetical protein SAMN05444487_10710 [Marininema mesophilum]|uniref:Uncharacterized protein n=1 Tax=Marininema mesophilum TaxID=1048340 RepID=A0A1H2WXT9_9BACL|nr:hypothetical protein [Marininema mesophilum]SDW85357.1 hypothetical protein SAMN05444487_10710 [Marininema mesophilum]
MNRWFASDGSENSAVIKGYEENRQQMSAGMTGTFFIWCKRVEYE